MSYQVACRSLRLCMTDSIESILRMSHRRKGSLRVKIPTSYPRRSVRSITSGIMRNSLWTYHSLLIIIAEALLHLHIVSMNWLRIGARPVPYIMKRFACKSSHIKDYVTPCPQFFLLVFQPTLSHLMI